MYISAPYQEKIWLNMEKYGYQAVIINHNNDAFYIMEKMFDKMFETELEIRTIITHQVM